MKDRNIVEGMKFFEWRPEFQSLSIIDRGFMVGDLVTLHGHGLNSGGVIYRITKDSKPINAVWARYRQYGYYRSRNNPEKAPFNYTWCYEKKRKSPFGQPVPKIRLNGCIELTPVFAFFPFSKGKKVVGYEKLKRHLKKVDVLKLGLSFHEFQIFLQEEINTMKSYEETE